MTCIVGIARGQQVLLGGDSAFSDSESGALEMISTPKVFRRGEILVGFSGDILARDLLAYVVDLPPIDGPPDRWVRRELVPVLRAALRDAQLGDEEEPDLDLIVALPGHLYRIQQDLSVYEPERQRDGLSFVAIGNGGAYAMAACYALREDNLTLRQLATTALETAHHYCTEVRPPWRFVEAQ